MVDFRRDKYLIKKTITEECLKAIDAILEEVEKRLLAENAKSYCYLSFLIRYDDKGYRLYSFNDLLVHFRSAKKIEKITFRLDVNPSLPVGMSNKEVVEVFMIDLSGERSFIAVEGSDSHWVNATFSMLADELENHTSKFSLVRGAWVPFVVQIAGVVLMFILSLIAGKYVSPYLSVVNALVLTFLFFFLIFSNIWTYINPSILNLVFSVFPNIYFKRKDRVSFLDTAQDKIFAGLLALGGIIYISVGISFIRL